ncbi:hypothetical protein B0J17DRAFT_350364 [Rhizoctonia solani]|nr:hypothetical protein B0J17DRAFT_350364 [Rhizoctonia solani]
MDLSFEASLAERLFPSIKHFAGPVAICEGIVASQLAEQLEGLNVVCASTEDSNGYNHNLDTLAKVIKPLPKLQEFTVTTNMQPPSYDPVTIETGTLNALLSAMPNVWSALITTPVEWTEMLQPLRHVPRLVEFYFVDSRRSEIKDTIYFKQTIVDIFATCPKLLRIVGLRYEGDGSHYLVNRKVDAFGVTDISFHTVITW